MKKLLKVLPVIFMVVIVCTSVFATKSASTGVDIAMPDKGTGIDKIDTAAKNVWATVLTICQILAIAAVIFAGLRYMFASADQKADIKKSMGILAVGAILVFAATTIIQFVIDAANQVIQ